MSTESYDALLHDAITDDDLAAVQRHLDASANPDASLYHDQRVPLVRAIERGLTESALLLISRGATLSAISPGAPLPLEVAARAQNFEVCEALIAHGAPINEHDGDGLTPLLVAASKLDVPICRLLIENGADVNFHGNSGLTPVRLVVVSGGAAAVKVLDMLVKAGANTGAPEHDDRGLVSNKLTAFQYAVASGFVRQVAYLLNEAGEDPEQITRDGRTMFDLSTRGSIDELLRASITARRLSAAIGDSSETDVDRCSEGDWPASRLSGPKFGAL